MRNEKPVTMPFTDKYHSVIEWAGPAPSGISDGSRHFEITTTGYGWNLLTGLRALAVELTEDGAIIWGDRSMISPKESGYQHEGRVSVGGKRLRCFTSSKLFNIEGQLTDIAILYVCR